jgi:hypothetical protein
MLATTIGRGRIMRINRADFLAAVRPRLFGGRLSPGQVEGLEAILEAWERHWAGQDRRWLAYALATAHHETGRTLQAVRETGAATDAEAIAILDRAFSRGRLAAVTTPYWRPDADGRSWLGRGLVQLTHKRNDQRLGKAIGVDLVADPGQAMRLPIAARILLVGMTRGLFTGDALADHFGPLREDWHGARRIINGLDRATLVAGYARLYHASLGEAGGTGTAPARAATG